MAQRNPAPFFSALVRLYRGRIVGGAACLPAPPGETGAAGLGGLVQVTVHIAPAYRGLTAQQMDIGRRPIPNA